MYIHDKKTVATTWVNLKNIKLNNTGTGKQILKDVFYMQTIKELKV